MIKRYTFHFSARITKDVEFPDGCEEGSAEWEAALDQVEGDINVDRYSECDECYESRDGTPVSK